MGTKVESAKPYKIKPYLNSNKDPFGLTIKGNTKQYISAHKNVQDLVITGKNISTKEGKIKIIEASRGKGMLNAIVEVNMDDIDIGNVEMKIYDPSVDKKKGATIELRKLSDSDFEHVDKLKSIVCSLLDKSLNTDVSNQNSYFRALGQKKRYVCDICSWETSFEQALKGHKKRMHSQLKVHKCNGCGYKSETKSALDIHVQARHKPIKCNECEFIADSETRLNSHLGVHTKVNKKRQKLNFTCDVEKCDSTFYYESNLSEHKRSQHGIPSKLGFQAQGYLSPSSSPPRKRHEKDIDDNEEEMLDLDDMEIVIEKELNVRFLLEKRIKEIEQRIDILLVEKKQDEEFKIRISKELSELKLKTKKDIPKHLTSVHEEHLPVLKGFRMKYNIRGNGNCLENCAALHTLGDEEQGTEIRRMIYKNMADNWFGYWREKIALPFEEVIKEDGKEILVRKGTDDEMVKFLKS